MSWRSGEAEWFDQNIKNFYIPVSIQRGTYVFKEGTRTLDIEMEPNIYADTLSKMGFIFFKINNDRLRASSFDVQSKIILDLSSHYLDPIEEDSIPYNNNNCLQFVLMEKKTGRFAAVLFAELYKEEQLTEILSLSLQYNIQGRNLGSMLCALSIDYYYTNQRISIFQLNPFGNAVDCYLKLGFIQTYHDREKQYPGEMVLDLNENPQVFMNRKLQLQTQPFFGELLSIRGNLEKA